MELSRNCRLFALQCFEWAAKIDDPAQHMTFVTAARDWLSTAKKIDRSPSTARETVQARLH